MTALTFDSRGWDNGARIAIKVIGGTAWGPSVFDPPPAGDSYSIDWGDGTTESGTLTTASSGGIPTYEFPNALYTLPALVAGGEGFRTHDYGGDGTPRTITIDIPTARLHTLEISGCGLTDVDGDLDTCTELRVLKLQQNFLTSLPNLNPCTHLQLLDVSHNWLTGDTYAHVGNEMHNLDVSKNGYTRMSEYSTMTGLLRLDVSHNPITRYFGTVLPPALTIFEAHHCNFRKEYVEQFGFDLNGSFTITDPYVESQTGTWRTDLNPALSPPESQYAPTHPNALPVTWIDFANDIVLLPFNGVNWPDPAVVGYYTIGSGGTVLTVISKTGSQLHAHMMWRRFVGSGLAVLPAMYHWDGAAAPGSRYVPVILNGGSGRLPQGGSGVDFWDYNTFTTPTHNRSAHVTGGDNVVPSSLAQTAWDSYRSLSGSRWSGTPPYVGGDVAGNPPYNTANQDTGVPRPAIHSSGSEPTGLGITTWFGSHAHTGDTSTNSLENFPGMQIARGRHYVANGAVHLGVLVWVFYNGSFPTNDDKSQGHVSYLRLNDAKCRPVGMPSFDDNGQWCEVFWCRPEDVKSYSLSVYMEFDQAMSDISYVIAPVRDSDPVSISTMNRGVPDGGDTNIGRANWHTFATSSDLCIIGASKAAAHKDAVTVHGVSFPGITNQTPWGSLTPTNSGSTLLAQVGYRYGDGTAAISGYWTRDAGGVGNGVGRVVVCRPRRTFPLSSESPGWGLSNWNVNSASWPNFANDYALPFDVISTHFKQAMLADGSLCALGHDGKVYVSGNNWNGKLGIGNVSINGNIPLQMVSLGGSTSYNAIYIWEAENNTIIITDDNTLWIAGNNPFGMFGTVSGDPGYASLYYDFVAQDKLAAQAVTCVEELIVLGLDGLVYHRGQNGVAQGGFTADASDHKTWTQVGAGILADVTKLQIAYTDWPHGTVYAVNGDGGLYMWGRNHLDTDGSVIGSTSDPIDTPTVLIGLESDVTDVGIVAHPSTTRHTVLAVKGGDLWAAGNNERGGFGENVNAWGTTGSFLSQAARLTPFPETVDKIIPTTIYAAASFVRGTSGKLYAAGQQEFGEINPWRQGKNNTFNHQFRREDEPGTEYWMDGGELWIQPYVEMFPTDAKLAATHDYYSGTVIWMEELPPSAPAGTGRKIRSWIVD